MAPKEGETESKTLEGVLYKWCGKCKRWTSGEKYLHSTSEHKSKQELTDKSLNIGVETKNTDEDSPGINSGGLQMHSLFTGLIHNDQQESREHLIDRLYPDIDMEKHVPQKKIVKTAMSNDDKPMEGDNYVKSPPGVSSAKMTIYGVDDQMEGDKNTEFLPDIKAVTNATDKPNEGDNYVKGPPGVSTVTKNVTNVKDKPMEGDSYVKGPPGVDAVTNLRNFEYNVNSFYDTMDWLNSYKKYVTNVYDKPMEGDIYVKDPSGVNVVTTLRKDMDKDENPMEGDNTIRCPPGVSSGTLKTCGSSDSMEGDENIKFIPDIKTTINIRVKPMEGGDYVKVHPGVNKFTNNITNVRDIPMEEDNYVKSPPGVGAVTNTVKIIKERPM